MSTSLISSGQNLKYHYIIPSELGERMDGISKIAFLDINYIAPVEEGAVVEEKEYDAGDELVKLMIEKQKKELLGEEAYNQQLAASRSNESSNSMGGALVSNITSILLQPTRGKSSGFEFLIEGMRTDVYTVVDRATIDRVLSEQQFQASGVVDGQQMSEIGVLLGADAIISGELVSSKDDKRLPEEIEKHTKSEKYKDKDGKEKTRQVFDYNEYIYKVQRVVTSNFNIQVVSVKTGEVLGTKNFTETSSDVKSRSFNRTRPSRGQYPSYDELASVDNLVRNTLSSISENVANLLSPRFGGIIVKIEKVKAKEYKQISKEAADFLNDGELEKAYAIYKTIYDADPYIAEAAFNLGIIYEATGQYKKSLKFYESASDNVVGNSDEKKYSYALERAEKGIEVLEQLKANGIVLEKQLFSDDEAESLMAEKVTTKGNPKKDRFDVYESASSGSPIIGKIPGGREFPMFKVEGDWTYIEIMGGKRGYIQNENLK